MFIDIVEIAVQGGKGGRGLISFRREKGVPYGGPSGGDGGDGGSVILVADAHQRTLSWFRGRRFIVARNGGPGGSNKKSGKDGEDRVIPVPLGTVIYEKSADGKEPVADLDKLGEGVVVARGGRHGRGNARFATPTRQAPEIAEPGEPGEEKQLILELKILADVGIVGKPNAGKSTLLAAASRARPKIADYPFTTKEPVLGIVNVGWTRFVLAEIPGLIEGAHEGRGLGLEFLRHAERTKLLIHLVDGSSADPDSDLAQVREEIRLYSPQLAAREQIVVVNKTDIPQVRERMPELQRWLSESGEIWFVSAATGEGVADLMKHVASHLEGIEKGEGKPAEPPLRVFRPPPVDVGRAHSDSEEE